MKQPRLRLPWGLISLLALSIAISMTIWACGSDDTSSLTAPERGQVEAYTVEHPTMLGAIEIQERHTSDLMSRDGVVGTGVSVNDAGDPVVVILTERALPGLPTHLDGVPVRERVTGKFKAMKGRPGGGGGGTGIKLGTSGGWRYDLANGYCCGGTLGSLVTDGSTQYVLSNYHVLRADIVSGGNGRIAQVGDPVISPGLIDVGCNANQATNVATLAGPKSLPGSNVDAAIAAVIAGQVSSTGEIQQIGVINSAPVNAFIGQKVKKRGRTSGLTRSSVTVLNATVSVGYENECAGGSAFTKTFTGQIIMAQGVGGGFLQGGDSGSLLVEDVKKNPNPIGLLFAGSSLDAVANPIQQVMNYLGVTMVGN